MATENVAGTFIKNVTATPPVPNTGYYKGRVLRSWGSAKSTTGVDVGSCYGLTRIASRAVIHSVLWTCDALSTSVTMDLGVYSITNPFAPVAASKPVTDSQECFAADIDCSSALTRVDKVYTNSSFMTTTKFGQPLWQILGLTVDPNVDYDVCATSTASMTAGGNMIVEIAYMMPSS